MNNRDTIHPGQIWRAHEPADEHGNRWIPRILVLSPPQQLACGLHAVSAVPLVDEGLPQLTDQDLALSFPLVPEELDPVVLMFSGLQSVLVGQLEESVGDLSREVFPLLRAFWKASVGVGPRPAADDFQPSLAWESGWPIPSPRDVRNERLVETALRMAPLSHVFDLALQDPEFQKLSAALTCQAGLDEALIVNSVLCSTQVLVELEAPIDSITDSITDAILTRAPRLRRAAGGGELSGAHVGYAFFKDKFVSSNVLTARDHLREMQAGKDPLDRVVHALLSGEEGAIRAAILSYVKSI